MGNLGKAKKVVTTAIICATLSGAGALGAYKINADKVFQNTHKNRQEIIQFAMTMQLSALQKSGVLEEDVDIVEKVNNFMQTNADVHAQDSKEQVNEQIKSTFATSTVLGGLVGLLLCNISKNKENKKKLLKKKDNYHLTIL